MKRRILIVPVVLLIMTALLAVWHLNSQPKVASGTVFISANNTETHVRLADLSCVNVQGKLIDGKGEMQIISAKGTELADVLAQVGMDTEAILRVTAVASDEYRAEIAGEELRTQDTVFLLIHEDSAELVVFGDENRKRNVANVTRLEVE